MHARAQLHHPTVCFDGPTPSHLVVSVTGDEGDRLRPSLGLVFVLDRSGSMEGAKLETVLASLRHLSGYLEASDEFALVSFAGEVTMNLAPTRSDSAGLEKFAAETRRIRAGGGTALDEALAVGIATANQMARRSPARVVRVIVLTDGQANVGTTDPTLLAGRMDSGVGGVSLSTIGVGYDCDHDLLGALAARGSGNYGFVEGASQAAEVLGTEIGSLVNLDAANVEVRVEAVGIYLSVGEALGVTHQSAEPGFVRVRLGHLVAGQTRHLVFPVTALSPKRPFARPVTVANVTLSGVVESSEVEITMKPKIHFVSGPTQRDESLDEPVDMAVLAKVQNEAERRAARQDFQGAVAVMQAQSFYTSQGSVLSSAMTQNYSDQATYTSSSVERTSLSSMLSPSGGLIGSSTAFDALANRTIGSYVPSVSRSVGLDTAAWVASSMTHSDSSAINAAHQSTTAAGTLMPNATSADFTTTRFTGLASSASPNGATSTSPVDADGEVGEEEDSGAEEN